MVTARQIESVVDEIARRFKPQQVILFGSYAYGTPTEDSDVDLLVVKRHRGHTADAACRIRTPLEVHFSMDLLVRSPAAIRRRLALGDYFISDIVNKGIILHENDDARMGQQGRRRLRRRRRIAPLAEAHAV
jgi:predicted nucleotidyltransferase